MAGKKVQRKARLRSLDLENLPCPAKHLVLMHLRKFEWYQIRQVSRSWLAAVDLEVRHLAEGSHLPRELASRFPGLRSLDLEYCDRRVSAKQLTHALLNLPSLEALLNVYNLDWVSLLLGRRSASDQAKRARLSAGMTSLSFGELLDPHQCKLPIDLTRIAKEWSNLRTIRLPHRLSGKIDLLALLKPLKASLQSLDLQSACSLPTAMRNLELASLSNLTELRIESRSHHALEDLLAHTLTSHTKLSELSISGNFLLTDGGAECLTRLQNLTKLRLESSNKEILQIETLSALTKLKCLEVPDCLLDDTEDSRGLMQAFPGLKELNAEGGYLIPESSTTPLGLTSLTTVCCGVCEELTFLGNLQRLHLTIFSCEERLAQVLGANCQQLTYLHLHCETDAFQFEDDQASLMDEDMPFLARLEKLRYLGLTNCGHLTSAGLARLAPLSRLGFLNLSWSNPCILQLPAEELASLAHLPLQWLSLVGDGPTIKSTSLPSQLRPAFERALSNRIAYNMSPSPEVVQRLCMTAGEAVCAAEGRYKPRARRQNGYINPI